MFKVNFKKRKNNFYKVINEENRVTKLINLVIFENHEKKNHQELKNLI